MDGTATQFAHLIGRKGPARISAMLPEVIDALNGGHVPTVSLTEFLALDVGLLARNVARQIGLNHEAERLVDTVAMLDVFKPMQRHTHIARALYDITSQHHERDAAAHRLATHPSDVARCWAAQWVSFGGLPLEDALASVRRFAADPHFGVREMAWMAVRDPVAQSLDEAIDLLLPWVHEPDANLRRFASELTRPKGVWCAQIGALKTEPWRGLSLIEPLRSDESRYVQNSVANWLNDAAKTQPEWVVGVCDRWLVESPTPETRYIAKRAQRSL